MGIVKEIQELEDSIEKTPLESKKFWAMIVGIGAVFMLLFVAAMTGITPDLIAHGMEAVIWLVGIFVTGQASQDVVKVFKGWKVK